MEGPGTADFTEFVCLIEDKWPSKLMDRINSRFSSLPPHVPLPPLPYVPPPVDDVCVEDDFEMLRHLSVLIHPSLTYLGRYVHHNEIIDGVRTVLPHVVYFQAGTRNYQLGANLDAMCVWTPEDAIGWVIDGVCV